MSGVSDSLFPYFDIASLSCTSSLPVKMLDTSRHLKWSALLLDHHQVLSTESEFETVPTTDHTIVVMTRGQQEIAVYGRGRWRRAVYRPGTIGMTPGGLTDRLRRRVDTDAGPACKINLYIPHRLFDEAADELGRVAPAGRQAPVALAHTDGVVEMAARTLLRALRADAPALYADSMAHWLCVHLLTSLGQIDESYEARVRAESIRDQRLKNVLEFIEHNLAAELTLDRLARESAVSKFHFTRLFRQATGSTPHHWISDRRLSAGRHLLETTDLSITEVAHQCGFARSNHFTSAFVKKFGKTPRAYRLGC